ncbi:hypothetical protein DIPPA_03215 [Diplonema papillatum]|nr:hypothetical protein DIPPA_03215 [Diplonema papillatum]
MTEVQSMASTTLSASRAERQETSRFGSSMSLFPVLMILEGVWPGKVVAASVVVDFMQFLGFFVNPYYNWGGFVNFLPDVFYATHFPLFDGRYASFSYMGYTPCLWLFAATLAVVTGGCVVVGGASEKKQLGSALRLAATCLCTWLFVPALHCIAALTLCGPDGVPWQFPDVQCYGAQHVAHMLAGLLICVVYLPLVYLVRRAVFDTIPTRYFYSRGHTLMDAVDFWCKVVSVVLFHVLTPRGETTLFVAFCLVFSTGAALHYGYLLPYYDKRANGVKIGQMTAVAGAAAVYLATEALGVGGGGRAVLLCCLLPVFAGLGYVWSAARLYEDCLAVLRDVWREPAEIELSPFTQVCLQKPEAAFVFPRNLPTCDKHFDQNPGADSASAHSSRNDQQSEKHGNSETWKGGYEGPVVTYPYVSSVNLETDVELATRVNHEVARFTGSEPAHLQVQYCLRIFNKGLLLYRDGVLVKLQYMWFLLATADKPYAAYLFFEKSDEITRVFAISATLYERYNSYKLVERLRKKLHIREKHQEAFARKALHLHEEVLSQMYQFWQRLMELSVDMVEIGHLASSIAENREKGMNLFKRALTGDTRMLNTFADFLEGVMLNKDAAKLCWDEIAELELEKKARQMGGSRKQVSTDEASVVQRLLDNVTSQKDNFGTAASSTVRKLAVNMNLVFLLLTLLIVGNLLTEVAYTRRQKSIIEKLDAAGQARMLAQRAAYQVYDVFSAFEVELTALADGTTTAFSTAAIDEKREMLEVTTRRFVSVHNILTHGSQKTEYSPHVRYYEEPVQEIILSTYTGETAVLMSTWEVGNALTNALHTINLNVTSASLKATAEASQEFLSSNDVSQVLDSVMTGLLSEPSVKFVLVNAPQRIATAFNQSMEYYEDEAKYQLMRSLESIVWLFAASSAVILAIYLLFLWNFKKITVSKLVILQLFTLIPYDTLARLSLDAEERVSAVRGMARHKTKRAGEMQLPKPLIREIEAALSGQPVENSMPLLQLEGYLRVCPSSMLSKLQQYIKLVRTKAWYSEFDPETLEFVKQHIICAQLPPSCIKNCKTAPPMGSTTGSGSQNSASGTSSARRLAASTRVRAKQGEKVVCFGEKAIIGQSELVRTEETSQDGAEEPQLPVDEDMKHVVVVDKPQKPKRQPATIPLLFWLQNVLMVSVAVLAAYLIVSAASTASTLSDPFLSSQRVVQTVRDLQETHESLVYETRLYSQFGDLNHYLQAMAILNRQVSLSLRSSLLTHDVHPSIEILTNGQADEQVVHQTLRAAMALTSEAFGKSSEMTHETADTTWGTPVGVQLQEGRYHSIIAKYGKYFFPPSSISVSKEDSALHTDKEKADFARSMVYSDVFEMHYKTHVATINKLLVTEQARAHTDIFDRSETYMYTILVALYATAVLCLLSVHTFLSSRALASYRKAGTAAYVLGAVALLVAAVFAALELGEMTNMKDAIDDVKLWQQIMIGTFDIVAEASYHAQQYAQFGQQHFLYDYLEHIQDIDPTIVLKERLQDQIKADLRMFEAFDHHWREMRRLELISLALLTSALGVWETDEHVRALFEPITWDLESEPDYLRTIYDNPICQSREQGCRQHMYSSRENDFSLPYAEQLLIARETLSTRPYTDHVKALQTELRKIEQAEYDQLMENVANSQDLAKKEMIVIGAIGWPVLALVILVSCAFTGHILIELAGGMQKGIKKNNQLDSPLLRKLLLRSRFSLLLVFVLIAIIFSVGVYSIEATRDQAADLNLVSAREWLVSRSMVYANELTAGSSDVYEVAKYQLASMVDYLSEYRDALYFGDPVSSDYNEVIATAEQTQLTFGGDDPSDPDDVLTTYYQDICENTKPSVRDVPSYRNELSSVGMPLDLALRGWNNDVKMLVRACQPESGCDELLDNLRGQVRHSMLRAGECFWSSVCTGYGRAYF